MHYFNRACSGVGRETEPRATRTTTLYQCPCCRCFTLGEPAGYSICPVCFWEDDGQNDPYADEVWGGPNSDLSLTAARENFARIGACQSRLVQYTRPATPAEWADQWCGSRDCRRDAKCDQCKRADGWHALYRARGDGDSGDSADE